MKRNVFFLLVVLICTLFVTADAYEQDIQLEYGTYKDGIIITYCSVSASKEELVIPAEIEGKPVLAIGSYAFSFLESRIPEISIERLYLPDTIELIDDYALCELSRVKEIHLPKSLMHIGKQALPNGYGCTASWDANDEYYLFENGFVIDKNTGTAIHCFSGENEQIQIPDGVVELSDYLFFQWPIKEVSFPNSLRIIGEGAFCECTELQSVTFPQKLQIIGDHAFEFCSDLQKLIFPGSLLYIGERAFSQQNPSVYGQLFHIELNDGLLYIGDYAFADHRLQEVYLPESVIAIGDGSFASMFEDTVYYGFDRFEY